MKMVLLRGAALSVCWPQAMCAPPAHEAIRQACLLRFRPILMTTAAAMFAGIPLAFGTREPVRNCANR